MDCIDRESKENAVIATSTAETLLTAAILPAAESAAVLQVKRA